MNKYTFRITLIATIVVIVLFYIALISGWFGIINGNGSNFCEAAREGIIKQPSNSFSNIGFVISGLYCAWILSNTKVEKNNSFYTNTIIPKFYCIIVVLLGPCSMAMHATETSLGGLFDMNSMYLFAAFMFTYSVVRYYKLSSTIFIITYLMCLVICNIAGQITYELGIDFYLGSAVFGLFCVLGMLYEFLNFRNRRINIQFKYAVYCSLTFLLAFYVWHFGWDGHCYCHPNSWFQWHGVWHLLCSLSTFFMFKYYISENSVK